MRFFLLSCWRKIFLYLIGRSQTAFPAKSLYELLYFNVEIIVLCHGCYFAILQSKQGLQQVSIWIACHCTASPMGPCVYVCVCARKCALRWGRWRRGALATAFYGSTFKSLSEFFSYPPLIVRCTTPFELTCKNYKLREAWSHVCG